MSLRTHFSDDQKPFRCVFLKPINANKDNAADISSHESLKYAVHMLLEL
jgi:hypothetical protein